VLPLIALQQTQYQRPIGRWSGWDTLRLRQTYNRVLLHRVEAQNVGMLGPYAEWMRGAADAVLGAAPRPHRVLDVGGGVGGLGIALHERLGDSLRYTLLDREGIDRRIWYGLREFGAKYNSLATARDFCAANGVHINTVDIDAEAFPSGPFDLIVSTVSWGFHYPIATYAKVASEALGQDGKIVLDVRRTKSSDYELAAAFPGWTTQRIAGADKRYHRLVLHQ
jgi:SAM-dependent methyltransferase